MEFLEAVFQARFDIPELLEFHQSRKHMYCLHVFDPNEEEYGMVLVCGRGKDHEGKHEDIERGITWEDDKTPEEQACLLPDKKDLVMWKGDWRSLQDKVCTGNVEVWDQTVGCPDCGMNLWYLPDGPKFWPAWVKDPPPDNWWDIWKENTKAFNPYDPYADLFDRLHPLQFHQAHDPGDEDRER